MVILFHSYCELMFYLPLFDKCKKSGTFLELYIIAAAAITFIIHYSILKAVSRVGCRACTEQTHSIYPNCLQALWLQSIQVCLASIISRKKRAERRIVSSINQNVFPCLLPGQSNCLLPNIQS